MPESSNQESPQGCGGALVGMLLSFLMIIIAGGHGIGPIGLMLFVGPSHLWWLLRCLMVVGIVAMIVNVHMPNDESPFRVIIVLSAVVLLGIVAAILPFSEAPFFTFITTWPFVSILLWSTAWRARLLTSAPVSGR